MSEKQPYKLPDTFLNYADKASIIVGNEGGMPFIDASGKINIQFEAAMQGESRMSMIIQLADLLGENRMSSIKPSGGDIIVRFQRSGFEKVFK